MFKKLYPSYYFASIYDIPMTFFTNKGIKALFVDLDNTLVGDEDRRQPEHFKVWYQSLLQAGIELVIVSNNRKSARVKAFVEDLPIEWYHLAMKQNGKIFNRLFKEKGLKPNEVAVIGDRVTTDIYGGNKVQALTILTKPITPDHDWYIKAIRKFEQLFIPKYEGEQNNNNEK